MARVIEIREPQPVAAVGRVDVRDESVLPLADQLFLQSPAPFCGSVF
jgi:hypothetical protein